MKRGKSALSDVWAEKILHRGVLWCKKLQYPEAIQRTRNMADLCFEFQSLALFQSATVKTVDTQ